MTVPGLPEYILAMLTASGIDPGRSTTARTREWSSEWSKPAWVAKQVTDSAGLNTGIWIFGTAGTTSPRET